jgi:hypothetical protein
LAHESSQTARTSDAAFRLHRRIATAGRLLARSV